jgi:flagellar assembly protein FliH
MRGAAAVAATSARFDVPLGQRLALPPEVAAQLRAEAQAAGYAAGWAEGCRAAEEATRASRVRLAEQAQAAVADQQATVNSSLRAIAGAVARFEQRAAPAVAGLEAELVAAAFALAQTIVGRELATATDPGADALRRVLTLAPAGRPVLVRMNPAEAVLLAGASTVNGREVVVVADPALTSGDAVLECDATTIDARIGSAVARAREALHE